MLIEFLKNIVFLKICGIRKNRVSNGGGHVRPMAVGICASRSYRETRCDSPSQLAFPARGTTAKVNFRSYVSFGRSTVGWG